jgi:hypothetical protein
VKLDKRSLLVRVVICVVAGLAISLLISEGGYLFAKDRLDRGPESIVLVIPRGTSDLVSAGQSEPSLPPEMSFVQGDTLIVKNEDTTSHQLGPVWVPAGASGSMVMDAVNTFSYECSFQPSHYLGVNIHPRVTWGTRLTAMLILGLPTIGMLLVYSFVFNQPKPKTDPTGLGVN